MLLINLTLSGPPDAVLAQNAVNMIGRLTTEILRKKPELTVVTIALVPDYLWFINTLSLAELKTKSFQLAINITDSTNLKGEKAA